MTSQQLSSATVDATGGYRGLPELDGTQGTSSQEAGVLRQRVRHLGENTRQLHEQAWARDLERSCQQLGRMQATDLLAKLSEWGFAWRDIARMIGVSVPALKKWRRGENITGENRLKLAALVALVDKVSQEMLVNDPASWFETPVKEAVGISPIDLVAADKALLVLDLASSHSPIDDVLAEFDTDWREKYVDDAFETFVADDGMKSIRPRM